MVKPDVQTTSRSAVDRRPYPRAGLPPWVFTVVAGEDRIVGPLVIDRSDYVMFTGSTAVGRRVAARCGELLIGCSMELGGKNAMIVRGDADIIAAASRLPVGRASPTQPMTCISMERIYVDQSVVEEFLDAFARRTQALRMSAQIGWGADVGSLMSLRQRDRVAAHVENAVTLGADVIVGGEPRPDIGPYFFEPTILTECTKTWMSAVWKPSDPWCRCTRWARMLRLLPANDSEYGLNAAIASRDTRAARAMARSLRAGTVNINEGYAAAWASRAPMGAWARRGWAGVTATKVFKYTESQTIATQRALGFDHPLGWSDEQWGDTLAQAMGFMKNLGLK